MIRSKIPAPITRVPAIGLVALAVAGCGGANGTGVADRASPTCPQQQTFRASEQHFNQSPVWSPDGAHLAFKAAEGYLAVIDVRTCAVHHLTVAGASASTWSPDGKRLAFDREVPGSGNRILVINADGSGERQVTREAPHRDTRDDPSTSDSSPAWSPRGDRIAFTRLLPREGVRAFDLFSVQPDGKELRRLTKGLVNEGPVGAPAWSRDGKTIALECGGDYTPRLCFLSAGGTDLQRIDPGTDVGKPSWSPDGRAIAFATLSEALVLPLKSALGFPARVPRPYSILHGVIWDLDWSPDGRWIAFTLMGSYGSGDLYIMRPDGTDRRALTRSLPSPG